MNVTQIPFNKFIGIGVTGKNDELSLAQSTNLANHLGTVHASAQFALAEACSGAFLLRRYPDLSDQVVPVVRKADIKFKKPATSDLTATASVSTEDEEKFMAQFEKKGRGTIPVAVKVEDRDGVVTATADYEWFVQKI